MEERAFPHSITPMAYVYVAEKALPRPSEIQLKNQQLLQPSFIFQLARVQFSEKIETRKREVVKLKSAVHSSPFMVSPSFLQK